VNCLSPEDWHYETELFRNKETCNLNKGYHANTENNQSRINKINVAANTTTNHDEIDANDVLAKNINKIIKCMKIILYFVKTSCLQALKDDASKVSKADEDFKNDDTFKDDVDIDLKKH